MDQLRGHLTEWLRERIKATGLSHAQLAKRSGVAQAQISKFMNAGTTLNLSTVDKLLPHVDAEFNERVDKIRFEQTLFMGSQKDFGRMMVTIKREYGEWQRVIEGIKQMLAVAERIQGTMTPIWEDEFWEDMGNRIDVPDPDTPADRLDDLFHAMRPRDRQRPADGD